MIDENTEEGNFPQEPLKFIRDEPGEYVIHDEDPNIDTSILDQGAFFYARQGSIELFGWTEALFLYRLDGYIKGAKKNPKAKMTMGRYWIFNTYQQWGDIFPRISAMTLRRAITKLEKVGIVIRRQQMYRRYYSINYSTWVQYLHDPDSYLKKISQG